MLSLSLVMVLFSKIVSIVAVDNNESDFFVCKNWQDYEMGNRSSNAYRENIKFFERNPNCERNNYMHLDMPEFLESRNISVKTFKVITRDGYILTLFRVMPPKSGGKRAFGKKRVVMLQHASLVSCTQWILFPKSLGLVLNERGYDVWLSNFRGSYYGRGHATLDPDSDPRYWDFTFHEMGLYDIPDQIDFILKRTGAHQLTFIGHSMAGTAATVYAASMPQHAAKRVNMFILFAAPTFMTETRGIAYPLAREWKYVYDAAKKENIREWMPRRTNPNYLFNLCSHNAEMLRLCVLSFHLLSGYNWDSVDWAQAPLITAQFPAGISSKSYIHFMQWITENGTYFRQFDYGGPEENALRYGGRTTPPDYEIGETRAPIYALVGDKDFLVSISGTEKYYAQLPLKAQFKLTILQNVAHIDYVTGKRLRFINKYVVDALKTLDNKAS